MRTGQFAFNIRYTQRRWFKPPRPVQVLMVQVDEPLDAGGCRAVFWREATESDVKAYEQKQRDLEIRAINAEGHTARLVARLNAIAETAVRP